MLHKFRGKIRKCLHFVYGSVTMNVSHASAVSDINAETDEGTRETNKKLTSTIAYCLGSGKDV